jgi:predicted nucleic acid-binding Zn ribbon protein
VTALGHAAPAPEPPEPTVNTPFCNHCGAPIEPRSRADRRTCSTTCRVAFWRANKAQRRLSSAPGDQDDASVETVRHTSL